MPPASIILSLLRQLINRDDISWAIGNGPMSRAFSRKIYLQMRKEDSRPTLGDESSIATTAHHCDDIIVATK